MKKAVFIPVFFESTEEDLELHDKFINENDMSNIMKQALILYYESIVKQN